VTPPGITRQRIKKSSSDYVMQTKSGEIIVTKGKPETDMSTGLVSCKDAGGFKHEINRDQITSIVEK